MAWQLSRDLEDNPDAQSEFRNINDPAHECVPKLLAFEEQHRGTLVGLMSLRRIVSMAARGGKVDSPSAQGRRAVLELLPTYVDKPELLSILLLLRSGSFEPAVEHTLRAIAEDEGADPIVREYSKFELGRWMLYVRDTHEIIERRLLALREGITPNHSTDTQTLKERLATLPAKALTPAWQEEAVKILSQVADSSEQLLLPEIEGVDPDWHLLRMIEEPTKPRRKISDSAKGALLKENQLRLGKAAPDLEVELLSCEKWSMAEQKDKAVIVQFSFKGCGPCERMYPDLRDLQEQYSDRLSILSIMVDEDRADTEGSVDDAKVTWNVHWDGSRRTIATLWAVRSYPTVYIVDTQGKIAGVDLGGEELQNKIAELLN